MINLHDFFVAEEILIQNILTKYGSWLNIFASRDVTLTS